jgi:hypothetical protein
VGFTYGIFRFLGIREVQPTCVTRFRRSLSCSRSSQSFQPSLHLARPRKPRSLVDFGDPNGISSSHKDSQRTESNKQGKSVDRKRNHAADRFKPSESVKPCSRRPSPFGDLLRTMKVSPACAS